MEDPAPEVTTAIDDLTNTNWVTRQRAADSLRELGKQAAPALTALEQALSSDDDYDVREAALKAIVAISDDPEQRMKAIESGLRDWSAQVRARGATELATVDLDADSVAERMWTLLGVDDAPQVHDAAVAVLRTQLGDERLTDLAFERLASRDTANVDAGIAVLATLAPAVDAERLVQVTPEALPYFARPTSFQMLGWLLMSFADSASNERIVLDTPAIESWRRARLLIGAYADTFVMLTASRRPAEIAELLLEALPNAEPDVVTATFARFGEHALVQSLDEAQRQRLEREVVRAAERGLGFEGLRLLDNAGAVLNRLLETASTSNVVEAVMSAPDLVDLHWAEIRDRVPALVLAGMAHPGWNVRQQSAEQVRRHARDLAHIRQHQELVEALEGLLGDPDSDVRTAAQLALTELRQEMRSNRLDNVETVLRSGDDSARGEMVTELLRDRSPEGGRLLVREFATWIACGDGQVVEMAAETVRHHSDMVLPLLDQWERGLELNDHVRKRLVDIVVPRDLRAPVNSLFDGNDVPAVQLRQIVEWLSEQLKAEPEPPPAALPRTRRRALEQQAMPHLEELLDAERERRGLLVRRRFARLLADMSDERFFDESEKDEFAAITRQLRRHAVRILGRRLATEEDITTRESIARTLANIGGRDAVDVLTRAIVDDERTKAKRQDLLAKYYLEPSKKRSDEAADILHGAVREAKRTLRLLQVLNTLYFIAALAVIVAGCYIALRSDDVAEILIGGATSVAGFVGLVIQVLREPLSRIQNAVTRLVQVETAFASFIWELNLNGTYIQSQYVAEGVLKDEHIARTVGRIESAMHLAMDLVSRYAEEGATTAVPRLSGIFPTSAGDGARITLRGASLKPPGRNGTRPGIVAVDHMPLATINALWEEDRVEFDLPPRAAELAGHAGTVWVTVLVDGNESNALPLTLLPALPSGNGVST
jgi:HEAT repeat protein